MVDTENRPTTVQSPTERVVQAVATHAGTDPEELPPIYGAIDPDALDAVVATADTVAVEFVYAGYAVSVTSDGRVDVTGTGDGGGEPTAAGGE